MEIRRQGAWKRISETQQEAKDLELKLANFDEWDGSIKRADWIEDRHRFERRRAFRRGRRGLSYLSPTASVSVSPARFKNETPENSINRFSPKMPELTGIPRKRSKWCTGSRPSSRDRCPDSSSSGDYASTTSTYIPDDAVESLEAIQARPPVFDPKYFTAQEMNELRRLQSSMRK